MLGKRLSAVSGFPPGFGLVIGLALQRARTCLKRPKTCQNEVIGMALNVQPEIPLLSIRKAPEMRGTPYPSRRIGQNGPQPGGKVYGDSKTFLSGVAGKIRFV